MNQRGGISLRVIFWVIFLVAAISSGAYFWKKFDPPRQYPFLIPITIKHYIKQMSHPHPKVAAEAWLQVHQLYFTKWAAYEVVLDHVQDEEPINFLVEKQLIKVPGKPDQDNFFAQEKPIYYKTEHIYCRTVGEAILALVASEAKGKHVYAGDWNDWWQKDKGYYGR